MELFSIRFWLFLKTFSRDDIGRARLQITFRVVRDNEIEVSAVCKRKAFFFSLSSSVITLYNLHFILKHMYRSKQIINSSLSSILCLACKPLRSLPVPQVDCWRLGDRLRWSYSLFNMSCKQFDISREHVADLRERWGKVSFRGIQSRLLPFSCLAEGLTLAVVTDSKDKDNSIENSGYNQVFLSLWPVLFLCTGEHILSQAICSASQGFVCSIWSTGNNEILSSKGQSSWKAAILGGGGECSWPTAPGALETFLDGVCVVCQRLHSAGGHSHHLKEPRTLCPVIRAMCPQSSFLTQLKVSFFLLCSCRLPPGFRITVLHNFKSVEESWGQAFKNCFSKVMRLSLKQTL